MEHPSLNPDRSSVYNLIFLCIIAGSLLFTSPVAGAGQTNAPQTFMLQERFGGTHPRQIVCFDAPPRTQAAPTTSVLVSDDGNPAPF